MANDYSEYFRRLYERVDVAVEVQFREVSLEGWQPELNKCHDNVDYWRKHHAESCAARGWIFWPPDETGRCKFMAHSVVQENGTLVDITPIDRNTPRESLRFLSHPGTEAEFQSMKVVCAEALYPPITSEEWHESQSSAENNEGIDVDF
jgi:hypothetical protein